MRASIIVLCGALASLIGCKDGGSRSADDAREFYDAAAPLLCDYALRCESPNDVFGAGIFCHPDAVDALGGELVFDQPNLLFDADFAGDCLDAIADSIESCSTPTAEICDLVFRGTQSDGEACDSDDECEPGLYCAGDSFDTMCAGTCSPTAGAGESCLEATCGEGLGCDETDTCVPLSGSGEPCSSEDECLGELLCDTALGECYPPSDAEGRPCEPSSGFDPCPPPTDCSPEGVCVRYELGQLAGPGESCSPGECVSLHVCADGSCEPLPVLGQSCDELRQCLQGACADGTCTLLANGETCFGDEQCESDRCDDELCVARAPIGGSCTFSSDCVEGAVCGVDDVCVEELACD